MFVAAHAPGEDPEAERAFQKLSVGADPNLLTAMADRSPTPGIDASGPNLGAIAEITLSCVPGFTLHGVDAATEAVASAAEPPRGIVTRAQPSSRSRST